MKKSTYAGTNSIIRNVLIGLLIGILASVVLALLIAVLIHNGMLVENRIKLIVAPIQFVAAFIGSLLAGKRSGQKYAIICGATVILYYMILLASGIMFFESTFQNIGLGIGMCAAGYISACAICMTGKKNKRKRKT